MNASLTDLGADARAAVAALDPAANRKAVLDALGPDEALLVFGGATQLRNGDAEHRYRPDSDVYWLTGWTEPRVAVFLRPGAAPFTIFVAPKDRKTEIWTGRRQGPEGARERFGADQAFTFDTLPAELSRLLQGVRKLHHAIAANAKHDRWIMQAVRHVSKAARYNGADTPEHFVAPTALLHELRLHKSHEELQVMRHAAAITALAHQKVMQAGKPGVGEWELEALLDHTYRSHGGNGPGYTHIVAAGDNATVLHYVDNDAVLADGQLVLVDSGCELGLYTADVTRTWPASGRFSSPQRDLYAAVLAAQQASIAAATTAHTFLDVHQASVRTLAQAMLDLGLLTGSLDEVIDTESYKRFYMHGTSHWLGLDVHDVGLYAREGKSRSLQPGMVMTIEPGLYVQPDDEEAPEAFRGIGIRIEDDVHITADGNEVLTEAVPTAIEALEALTARS